MRAGREAKVFVDGEELDLDEAQDITISFSEKFMHLELTSRYLDDVLIQCGGANADRILINTKVLKAIVEECLTSRELIMSNRDVLDDYLTEFDKKSFQTDTALMIGVK